MVSNHERLRTMHLFAGVGGGILADLILGHEPIVAVEWDRYACRVLRERVKDGWFEGMSVWEGDVTMFDPSDYKERVDCIHAGFPCQDISVAGNQAGVGEDSRSGLYREVLRISDEVRPGYIFLENVAAIVTGSNGEWLRTVTGDLASRGYDVVWSCLSAAEVGANHKRDRWWLLGYTNSIKKSVSFNEGISERSREIKPEGSKSSCGSSSKIMGDTLRTRSKAWLSKSKQWQEGKSNIPDNRSDQFTGRERGSWWSFESRVGRVVDGLPDRAHRLRGLGNAQVPLQAATAFSLLWEIMNDNKIRSTKQSPSPGISRDRA